MILITQLIGLSIFTNSYALVITNPQNGATFNEGDTITIKVEPSAEDPEIRVVVIRPPANSESCPILREAPYECQVTLIPGSFGEVSIGAIARTFSGVTLQAEHVNLSIRITATLLKLSVNDDQRTISPVVGNTRQLYVKGQYSDGIERSLVGFASGNTFETSDPDTATVDGEGVVTAVAPGEAVITVRNENLSLKIDVIVRSD